MKESRNAKNSLVCLITAIILIPVFVITVTSIYTDFSISLTPLAIILTLISIIGFQYAVKSFQVKESPFWFNYIGLIGNGLFIIFLSLGFFLDFNFIYGFSD